MNNRGSFRVSLWWAYSKLVGVVNSYAVFSFWLPLSLGDRVENPLRPNHQRQIFHLGNQYTMCFRTAQPLRSDNVSALVGHHTGQEEGWYGIWLVRYHLHSLATGFRY
jgi:hypothetical protein